MEQKRGARTSANHSESSQNASRKGRGPHRSVKQRHQSQSSAGTVRTTDGLVTGRRIREDVGERGMAYSSALVHVVIQNLTVPFHQKLKDMAVTLNLVRGRGDTVLVPMNQGKSCPSAPNARYLATEGLNGCTAVAIYSEHAGILAHIAPRTGTPTGEQNVVVLMQQVISHYNSRKRSGLFPRQLS